jgi:hypothetical protein
VADKCWLIDDWMAGRKIPRVFRSWLKELGDRWEDGRQHAVLEGRLPSRED